MSVEDKMLLRELQRELNRRRHLDLSDTKVNVSRGIGYISGIIRPSLGEFMDPKVEVKAITDNVKRISGLRDLVFEARFEISTKR